MIDVRNFHETPPSGLAAQPPPKPMLVGLLPSINTLLALSRLATELESCRRERFASRLATEMPGGTSALQSSACFLVGSEENA